jgi:hypothetical protein
MVVWDLDAHRPIGEIPLVGKEDFYVRSSTDQNCFALITEGLRRTVQIELYRTRPLTKLWERDVTSVQGNRWVDFAPGALLLKASRRDLRLCLEVYDVQTGNLLFCRKDGGAQVELGQLLSQDQTTDRLCLVNERIEMCFNEPGLFGKLLDRLRALWLPGDAHEARYLATTQVFDILSGDEVFHCETAEESHVLAKLSPDNQSLIRYGPAQEETTFQCYDVPRRRPWATIASVPLASAVLLLALRTAWRWRRSRARTAPQGGSPCV